MQSRWCAMGRRAARPIIYTAKNVAQARCASTRSGWQLNVPVPILAIFPIATFGLGMWQMRRLEWKTNLIREMEERMRGLPVALPVDPYEAAKLEHARVMVRGTFDHSKEMYIGPRSEITPGESKPGRVGAIIVTPLKRTDHNSTILVNRGFVPAEKLNPKTRPQTLSENEELVVGFVKRGEEPLPYMPPNRPDKNEWRFLDLMQMADWVNARPILVYAERADKPNSLPVGSQFLQQKLSNNHSWYAFTWFTLCLISGAYTVSQFRRRGFR